MGKKNLIGKKVRGFKFETKSGVAGYSPIMDKYIGKVGEIIWYADRELKAAVVKFDDGTGWFYPIDQIEEHLVKDELPSQYEVGMTVWDIIYGKGEIEFIDDTVNYPVSVQFKSCNKLYTSDGKPALYSEEPTLSLTPYDLVNGGATFPTFKPELPEIEKGTLVYVYNGNEWLMRRFSHFDEEGMLFCFSEQDEKNEKYGRGPIMWPEYSLTNPLIEKQ